MRWRTYGEGLLRRLRRSGLVRFARSRLDGTRAGLCTGRRDMNATMRRTLLLCGLAAFGLGVAENASAQGGSGGKGGSSSGAPETGINGSSRPTWGHTKQDDTYVQPRPQTSPNGTIRDGYGTQDSYGTQDRYGTQDWYGTNNSGAQRNYGTRSNYGTRGSVNSNAGQVGTSSPRN